MQPPEQQTSLRDEERQEGDKKDRKSASNGADHLRGVPPASSGVVALLIDNLDKALAMLLVFLLLAFFLQSSGSDPSKKTLTKDSLLSLQADLPQSTNKPPILDPTSKEKEEGSEDELQKFLAKRQKKAGKESTLQQILRGEDDVQSVYDPEEFDRPKKAAVLEDQSVSQQPEKPSDRLAQLKYLPHRHRSQFFKEKQKVEHLEYLKLAKFNLITPDTDEQQWSALVDQQRTQLQSRYRLSEFPQELSICAVVHASSPHKKTYAHEYLLNSILNQEYQHYSIVYVADGFTAEEAQPVKHYIKSRDKEHRVTFVWNTEKKYFLESTVTAVKAFCMEKRVTVLIDGDDELLGTQVFRVINTFYRRYSANVVYGNFIEYHYEQQQLRVGFATEYEDKEKKDNSYRSIGQKFGSIKTFKTRLISFIKDSDLRDSYGKYFRYAGDYALIYPLLELACGQVRYMPQYNYLYFGYEIDPTYGSMQIANGRAIRERARYDCFKKYK